MASKLLTVTTTSELYHKNLISVNKYQKDTKPNKHTKEYDFYIRHGYSDNRGNVVGGHYIPLNACTRRGVVEYAQRLHLLALGLPSRVWCACAIPSYAYGSPPRSRVGTGAYGDSGNRFGHAWVISPVIIRAIVIR